MKENELKVKVKINSLFETTALEEELDLFSTVLPPIAINDPDTKNDVLDIMEDESLLDTTQLQFDLLLEILENSNSIKDLTHNVDQGFRKVKNQYEKNLQTIYNKTKEYERTARSLNLIYENANGQANIFITPVSKPSGGESIRAKDFEEISTWLRRAYYKWFMDDSPFYISYIGDVGSVSMLNKLAHVAHETKALAVLDLRKFSKAERAIDYAKRNKLKAISPEMAHVVVPGTWVYSDSGKEFHFIENEKGTIIREENKMAMPSSGAIIGKLMSVNAGVSASGIEASRLVGIDGVVLDYNLEKIDSQDMSDAGILQIINEGYIQGSTTLNKSANRDLNKFDKVDVANAMLKDLVQFCNNKAFSRWGNDQKLDFQRELESYFNRRVKQRLIEGYDIQNIEYDQEEEQVKIDIQINFFEIVDAFEINLHGPKRAMDLEVK